MADLATLSRRLQLGVETTEGTVVPAIRRFPNMRITPSPQMNFQTYNSTGSKFLSSVVPGSEWTEGDYEGPVSFGEIVYPFSSLLNYVAPVTVAGVSTWTFTPNLNTTDTTKSFTMEIGNSAQADQVAGMFFNGITLTFSPDEASMKGSVMGYRLNPVASITSAGVTDVENFVANATRTQLYYASTFAGLSSGTLVTRAFNAELNIDGKYGTYRAMNAATTGYSGRQEKVPDATLTLTLGAEYSGTDFIEPITLADARAGAINYLRLKTDTTYNIGASSTAYSLTIDMACRVTAAYSLDSQDDVLKNVTWELSLAEDATSSKALSAVVTNATTAL